MRISNTTPKMTRCFWSRFYQARRMWFFGSRLWAGDHIGFFFFCHMAGNSFLTLLSNMFTNLNLSDMETGYKAFKASLINRFRSKKIVLGLSLKLSPNSPAPTVEFTRLAFHTMDALTGKAKRSTGKTASEPLCHSEI